MDDILEQKRYAVPPLKGIDALRNEVKRLIGLRHRQHDAKMFPVNLGVAEMLAVPGNVYLLKQVVEQV